ncbi:unnamed protein product, partial [Scytosiphon promiscuus]
GIERASGSSVGPIAAASRLVPLPVEAETPTVRSTAPRDVFVSAIPNQPLSRVVTSASTSAPFIRGLQGHRSCLPARRSVVQDRPCCVRPCSRDARSRGSRPVWSGLAQGAAQGGAGRGVGGCRSCEALRRGAGRRAVD